MTVRVDNDAFLGTPLPPEEPQANNPPDGAIVDYYLGSDAGKVTLQVLDEKGRVLRHFSSVDKPTIKRPLLPIAERWFPAPQSLQTNPGEHRFIWDLSSGGSGTDVEGDDIDAGSIPPGPRVPPGNYTVRLTVDGVSMERPVQVTMDPRSPATTETLNQQFALGQSIYLETLASRKAMAELESVETQLNALQAKNNNPADLQKQLRSALTKLETIKNGSEEDAHASEKQTGLADANAGLGVALRVVESGDRPAPAQAIVIFNQMKSAADVQIAAWQHFKATDLTGVDAALQQAHQPSLQVAAIEEEVHYAMTR
jgi:hypothetical protein